MGNRNNACISIKSSRGEQKGVGWTGVYSNTYLTSFAVDDEEDDKGAFITKPSVDVALVAKMAKQQENTSFMGLSRAVPNGSVASKRVSWDY